ncbi:MAG: M28 family peptidase [Planctomycetota bacterium]|nr:MAG: M28 family peptidase [Planctomycetota bacterium]
MYDDLGGWLVGRADSRLAAAVGAETVPLPPLPAGSALVAVLPHPGHPEPIGPELWAAPGGGPRLLALPAAALKAAANAGYACHGAVRPVELRRPLKPVATSPGLGRAITPNPTIQSWVAQVSQTEIENGVNSLVAFGTRRHGQPGEVNAQNWIQSRFASFGLATSLFDYDSGADVVIGELPGQLDPARIVVVGAHYDSINYAGSSAPAPGADDDGSGTAGVIEIARILSQQDFAYTIRFCAFSGEELGLLGSEAYAAWLESNGAEVIGMIQLDMTAYRAGGDPRSVDFVLNDTNPALNAFSMDCFAAYVPGLPVQSGNLAGGTSDHRSFTRHGFPAVFPFEDLGQYSPYIHTANDVVGLSANDFVLATQITQGALATAAELARPLAMSLQHAPLPDTQDELGPYTARLTATPLVGQTVTAATLHWRVDGGPWQATAMTPTGNPDEWAGDIPGQVSPATVRYWLEAEDSLGNRAWLPDALGAGDAWYEFIVGIRQVIFFDDFESDRGWTHQQVATQDDWQRGDPFGAGGTAGGVSWSDPTSPWSGSFLWGNDLGAPGWNGAYAANVHNWLESPPIDCSGASGTRLRFRRWLTVEEATYDQATIEINGSQVWRNPVGSHVLDDAWQQVEYDVSALADGNPSVRVRFRLQSDGGLELGGWNLDDVELYAVAPVGGATDTITLQGDTQGSVGGVLSYTIANAPALSPWWLVWAPNLNGQQFQGHSFDLGPPATVLAQGTTDAAGAAAWTSSPVPPGAAGRTIYLEVACRSGGAWFDSNALAVTLN